MRIIRDEYELPDDDDDVFGGYQLRKPRRSYTGWLVALVALAFLGAGLYLALHFSSEQSSDAFCVSCHTTPERTYFDRAGAASSGALAVDLSSFHYQTLRSRDSILHCIDCHRGNGGVTHRVDVLAVSTRNVLVWMIGRDDSAIEKLYTSAPHLSNDSCLSCHVKTLLIAGTANHWHNMLPATYELWRTGASIIPPAGTLDKQAVIAAGLIKYDASVLCSDCHQAHASLNDSSPNGTAPALTASTVFSRLGTVGAAIATGPSATIRQLSATHLETDKYLDKQINVPERCAQCHRETGKGPVPATLP